VQYTKECGGECKEMAGDPLVYSLSIPDYGRFIYKVNDKGLLSLEWQDEKGGTEDPDDPLELGRLLTLYFSGKKVDFRDIPVVYDGITLVYKEILEFIRSVPYGSTVTYKEVAVSLGRPESARVVGNAMRTNPCPIVVPCHRVIGRGGLGGYSLGIEKKILLLKLEGVEIC